MFEVPGIIPLARAALGLAGPVVRTAVGLAVQPHPEPGGEEERRDTLPSHLNHKLSPQPHEEALLANGALLTVQY